MTQRTFTTHPLVVRRVEVRRIRDITPRMRRITVGGEGLGPTSTAEGDHPPFRAPGFDDHVKLVFASDGDIGGALPVQLRHGIEWLPSETRVARDYTPRRVADDEVDLDFVMHGHGPAAAWAGAAGPGDELWFVGPKSSTRLPDDIGSILLAGDETALPAIGRFLDERPTEARATIVVSVADAAAIQELTVRPDDRIEWVVADPADESALDEAIRRLVPVGTLDAQTGYAWCAAESRVLLPVRRYLSREVGLPKARLNITGYWHREDEIVPAADSAGATETGTIPDGGSTGDSGASAPAPSSPAAWFVVRAALELGIVDALAASPGTSLVALAAHAGVEPERLEPLLPVLLAHDVIAGDTDSLRLGPFGDALVDDEHEREAYTGLEADAVLALQALAESVRSGRPAWQEHRGTSLLGEATTDADVSAELVEEAGRLAYLLDGFVAEDLWTRVERCVLTGPGAAAVANALADAGRSPEIVVVESGTALRALGQEAEDGIVASWVDATDSIGESAADAAVAALALEYRTDGEALELLRDLRRRADTVVVIESSRPDALGGAEPGEELQHLAITGAPRRDADAIGALAVCAGLAVESIIQLGWGVEAIVLERSRTDG